MKCERWLKPMEREQRHCCGLDFKSKSLQPESTTGSHWKANSKRPVAAVRSPQVRAQHLNSGLSEYGRFASAARRTASTASETTAPKLTRFETVAPRGTYVGGLGTQFRADPSPSQVTYFFDIPTNPTRNERNRL